MNRDVTLPTGLANLSDEVRVFDQNGADLGLMIVTEAQKRASEQGGELFVLSRRAKPSTVRIVIVKPAPSR